MPDIAVEEQLKKERAAFEKERDALKPAQDKLAHDMDVFNEKRDALYLARSEFDKAKLAFDKTEKVFKDEQRIGKKTIELVTLEQEFLKLKTKTTDTATVLRAKIYLLTDETRVLVKQFQLQGKY